ncbi:hypothetical protein [Aquincola tertiaricarbonis]|uniref:hypothetical protein n=1 Tax=Aquincola tertiaricarbonis TaxID=391953 RepID=UPI0012ECDE62|nr:hypothetical protein [Aquincola tertiaricarbonis]
MLVRRLLLVVLDQVTGHRQQLGQQRPALAVHLGHCGIPLVLADQLADGHRHGAVRGFHRHQGVQQLAFAPLDVIGAPHRLRQPLKRALNMGMGLEHHLQLAVAVHWLGDQHQVARRDRTLGGCRLHVGRDLLALCNALQVSAEPVVSRPATSKPCSRPVPA